MKLSVYTLLHVATVREDNLQLHGTHWVIGLNFNMFI
jgi:hypothetical protein